jgi:hypothetical protein
MYIKHGKYFIQVTREGYVRTLFTNNATRFTNTKEVEDFIEDTNLNLAHIEVVEFIPNGKKYYEGKWIPSEELALCSECDTVHYVKDMQSGVVDRESGVELFCNDCYEEVDLIIGNQPLDELMDNPLEQVNNIIESVKVE